jgi:hypothetical protein
MLYAEEPDTVAEWVQKYEPRDLMQEEADRLGIWGLISKRLHDQEVGVWLEDMPHRAPRETLEPLVDGNTSAEACTNNQPNAQADVELEDPEHLKRIAFLDDSIMRVITLLDYAYPNVTNVNEVPDDSIKNVVYVTLTKHGNLSEWLAKTRSDIDNPSHEVNLRQEIIMTILGNPESQLQLLEKKILCHIATCVSFLSAAHVLAVPDEQIKKLISNSEIYQNTYQKYNAYAK